MELSTGDREVSISRVMESVYELELGNLISKLETKNSVTF